MKACFRLAGFALIACIVAFAFFNAATNPSIMNAQRKTDQRIGDYFVGQYGK